MIARHARENLERTVAAWPYPNVVKVPLGPDVFNSV
jgi:hypothetical protein